MRILIVDAVSGETRELAGFMKEEAERLGHSVTVCNNGGELLNGEQFDIILPGYFTDIQFRGSNDFLAASISE